MNALMGIFNALVLLGVVLVAVWVTGRDPGVVTVVWQGWEVSTSAAVALIALLMGLCVAFYLGQFFSWLARLPAVVRGWFTSGPPKPELPRLVQALSLGMVDDIKGATLLLDKVNPKAREELLEAFARLQLNVADPAEVERWVDDAHVGPFAALVKAQTAAAQTNWELVRLTTQRALDVFGKLPALQILHLKALLNGQDVAKASAFLPQMRSQLTSQQYALLDMAVRGPTSTTAAKLDDPWFAAFQVWLSTPSVVLPDVSQKSSPKR